MIINLTANICIVKIKLKVKSTQMWIDSMIDVLMKQACSITPDKNRMDIMIFAYYYHRVAYSKETNKEQPVWPSGKALHS